MRFAAIFLLLLTTALAEVDTKDWKTFTSPDGDFSIQYPPGWDVYQPTTKDGVVAIATPEGDNVSVVKIQGKKLPQTPTPDYLKATLGLANEMLGIYQQQIPDAKLEESKITKLQNDYPAVLLQFNGTLQGGPLRIFNLTTAYKGDGYTFTLLLKNELAADDFKEKAIKILDSIQFSEPTKT